MNKHPYNHTLGEYTVCHGLMECAVIEYVFQIFARFPMENEIGWSGRLVFAEKDYFTTVQNRQGFQPPTGGDRIRPKKPRKSTWANVCLFQTLNDGISQLFSPLTSLAHSGMLVEFWPRLTHQFSQCFWSVFWFSGKCVFGQKMPFCDIQNIPRKGPLFGVMG